MVMKLPGRTLPSAGMNNPPELASKIVTLRTSPMPNRISLGRLRSGKSLISLGAALASTLATLGVTRTKAYGTFLGSCCPAQTSQLEAPLVGIRAHPPTARWDARSAKLKRIPTPRTAAPSPTERPITANDYGRSKNRSLDSSHNGCFRRNCCQLATPINRGKAAMATLPGETTAKFQDAGGSGSLSIEIFLRQYSGLYPAAGNF